MKLLDIIPLFESEESKKFGHIVNMSKKAVSQLSYPSKRAILQWQASGWDNGQLQQSYNDKDEIYQEITKVFAPIKQKIKQLFGETIRLHRGQKNYSDEELSPDSRQLFSFSFDERVAQDFAHTKLTKESSQEEIDKAVEQFERTGFLSYRGKKYKRSKNPKYFDIYDRRNNYITDGEDIRAEIESTEGSHKRWNDRSRSEGSVHSIDVPVDLIFWITNDLNSKEAIVAMNPLKKPA